MEDELGDRMKLYESMEARRLMPKLPVFARVDGRAFHTFTRGMNRPYDINMSELMRDTAMYLAEETQSSLTYVQSDEITMVWYAPRLSSRPTGTGVFFDGRVAKMNSILGAMASSFFNRELPKRFPERADKLQFFDCRVWTVPTVEEATNVFLWREIDATRNSIEAAAQANFSHTQLHGKHCGMLQEMLFTEKGINWNDYPVFFKRGTYIQKFTASRKFTTDELEKLPPKHAARTNPDLMVVRTGYRVLDMVPFARIQNKVEVVFNGADPQCLIPMAAPWTGESVPVARATNCAVHDPIEDQ